MKAEDFKALETGQRVVVSGTQDRMTFSHHAGVVTAHCLDDDYRLITFDLPLGGYRSKQWFFEARNCFNFTIEPEHRSTYLNGHSDLKQEGLFVTAWRAKEEEGGSLWLTDHDGTFTTQAEADAAANKLAEANAGETVVVLRAVSQHTSSVKVETKAL